MDSLLLEPRGTRSRRLAHDPRPRQRHQAMQKYGSKGPLPHWQEWSVTRTRTGPGQVGSKDTDNASPTRRRSRRPPSPRRQCPRDSAKAYRAGRRAGQAPRCRAPRHQARAGGADRDSNWRKPCAGCRDTAQAPRQSRHRPVVTCILGPARRRRPAFRQYGEIPTPLRRNHRRDQNSSGPAVHRLHQSESYRAQAAPQPAHSGRGLLRCPSRR